VCLGNRIVLIVYVRMFNPFWEVHQGCCEKGSMKWSVVVGAGAATEQQKVMHHYDKIFIEMLPSTVEVIIFFYKICPKLQQ